MTSKTFFVIGSFVTLIIAILLVSYRINAEKKIIKLFERNVNRSLCTLCLGNTASCNTLDFKLDYKRHADLRQDSNYLFMFLIVIKRLFEYWTSRQNDKIFFGYIKLNNIVVPTIAKSPGHYCSEHFERIVNITSGIDTITINNQWNLLPFSLDSRSLVLCSTDNTQSSSLLHNFFNSFRQYSYNTSNNFQSLVELWVSAHLNVELLVLKVLHGYRYVPDIYGICGRIYFVEDCGYTLQHHLNKMSLSNRLLVAKELLILALELTDGTAHSNYSFYLTDLTADNIAIRFDKTTGLLLSLKVIDWSDVILVANDHSMTKNDNLMIHVSEHVDCGLGCLVYSKEDICQSSYSDHNVYAVCKDFLSVEGNLLHGIIHTKENKEIESLVKYCLWYSDVDSYYNKSRIHIAKLIITEIQNIFQQLYMT